MLPAHFNPFGRSPSAFAMLIFFAFASCATGGTEAPTLYTPQFNYQPTDIAGPAEADVTFAIVSPNYSDFPIPGLQNHADSELPAPFREFARGFAADFQEMLIERGYSTTGPFDSYEEMTYPERQQADLVFIPSFQFGTRTIDGSLDDHYKVIATTYTIKGTDRMSGLITLAAVESLTKERMWFKKIDLPSVNITWSTAQEASEEYVAKINRLGQENWSGILIGENDPGVVNPIVKQLETYYSQALEATWDYLNPEEMARLKVMADSLKTDYQPGG